MAATFSITFTGTGRNAGYLASNAQQPAVQLEDTTATAGAQQFRMSQNRQPDVRGSDGVTRKYTIDASRSDPSRNLIYLLLA